MDHFLVNAGSYLIRTVFGLYIVIVLLRFLLQMVRADFYNPLSQFIVKATAPILNPLRRVIPGLFGIDIASLLLAYFLQYIENILLFAVRGISVNPIFLLWHSIGSLLTILLYIYFFAILVQVIISWVSPGTYNPATALIHHITEPVMRPARKILPPFSGFDLSPIIVFVVLNILIMFIPVIFG
ncbi:MAG: YggT family protein [gamma proteobacterium symbiont of Bathyaustriella thionipta]|nr:YggT family protein [gamma proteobacterium symbiont of Bathyaustriella thionipta]MCU7951032.1 YggT family protein [gamma proteobacterium symbiont of Bathyaustriella thionipta]MCU7953512.1 YggT family protein [gamma proteobacterium symbiont of Bathyaustriella thionipta]MCU7957538.1 YggT family protein [gamma proteobacterium symbiont of Bathyaustriella thionipta]MCU7969011.1 YggT family protein [gamma proteobacterium symbiont of Bathyaustriella thionipta]